MQVDQIRTFSTLETMTSQVQMMLKTDIKPMKEMNNQKRNQMPFTLCFLKNNSDIFPSNCQCNNNLILNFCHQLLVDNFTLKSLSFTDSYAKCKFKYLRLIVSPINIFIFRIACKEHRKESSNSVTSNYYPSSNNGTD